MKYLVTTNCKLDINEIDNTTIETNEPLKELKRLLPEFVIQKGNSGNWNITLWHRDTNRHLYYVVKQQ